MLNKTNIPDDIDRDLIEVFEPPVEDLVKEFKYRVKPTEAHEKILQLVKDYYENNEVFMKKKNRAAGRRARAALSELRKIIRPRRHEIIETINNMEKGEFL